MLNLSEMFDPSQEKVEVKTELIGTQYQVYYFGHPTGPPLIQKPCYAIRDGKPYVSASAVQAMVACQEFRKDFPHHQYEVHELEIRRVTGVSTGHLPEVTPEPPVANYLKFLPEMLATLRVVANPAEDLEWLDIQSKARSLLDAMGVSYAVKSK